MPAFLIRKTETKRCFYLLEIKIFIKKEYHNTNQPLLGLTKTDGKPSFKLEQYKIRLAEDNILIHQTCLKIVEKIGNGYFGCVFKAELKLPTQSYLKVAVKTLKNTGKL